MRPAATFPSYGFPQASSMRGEIIAIGDELTTGQRLDTNTQWLAERLTDAGVTVLYHTTVADDLRANIDVFAAAIQRADVVVATGGLGPTADDLTRDALAAAAGVPLELDEDSLVKIEQMFASRGREMPERNRLQAMVPAGARPIPNEHGTAPGVEMRVDRPDGTACTLFALPGVPAEMKPMWTDTVLPAVNALHPAPRTIRHRRLKCFGVGESQLEAMMPDLIAREREPLVGITVHKATITLRMTASGADGAECLAKIAPTEQEIRDKLGVLVFGEEDEELQDVVLRMLRERGERLATYDSASGGLLAHWLSQADVSEAFANGEVCPPAPLGADQAEKLAEHTRLAEGAEYGLVLAPAGGTQEVPSIIVAVADAERVQHNVFPNLGHPDIEHDRAAKLALNELRKRLMPGE
ncbi:CinA family nicotinamide mononucleotide deamidase-related protein [Posidoniimonas polymericola]|nr:CinA family nicotinamide mononucleotide deamidase-related protein [Posidoniimonas polymericola]